MHNLNILYFIFPKGVRRTGLTRFPNQPVCPTSLKNQQITFFFLSKIICSCPRQKFKILNFRKSEFKTCSELSNIPNFNGKIPLDKLREIQKSYYHLQNLAY